MARQRDVVVHDGLKHQRRHLQDDDERHEMVDAVRFGLVATQPPHPRHSRSKEGEALDSKNPR